MRQILEVRIYRAERKIGHADYVAGLDIRKLRTYRDYANRTGLVRVQNGVVIDKRYH